ncbi:MAG: phage major capsid protein, partial [Lentisphaeria bacterium]|nr:phage major capsid protein [Lentisphaeria bacterium]
MNPNPDPENLEITFTAASGEPYERFDDKKRQSYFERLVITPEAVNLTRLNGGASILKNHNPDIILGTIVSAWIEDDKLAIRARFRKNDPEAVTIFNDIVDGTLPNVSIGYRPDTVVPVQENGVNFRDLTRWTPFEVSVAVGVPADPTVGFYRSMSVNSNQGAPMPAKSEAQPAEPPAEEKENQNPENAEPETVPAEPAAPESDPSDQSDPSEIPPEPEKPAEPEEDPEVKQNRQRAVELRQKAISPEKIRSLNIPKERINTMPESKYSLVRAFQSLINPKIDASFERSVSDELASRSGLYPSANAIMLSFRDGELIFRDGEFTGANGVGAGMIGTDHRADLFIQSLRTRMGVKNATVLTGLVGNVDIPTQTGAVTVGIGAMNSTSSKTKPTVGSTVLTPKKFSAYVDVGEDLIAQGNPDAIAFVIDDLQAQLARKLDLSILTGNADPEILGVDGTTGVQTKVIANMASITWNDILDMYGKVADYEIEDGDLAWIAKGVTKANFMGVSKDAGSGRFLVEDDKMNGFPVNVCGGLTANDLYLGVWKNVVIGNWGGLEIKIDDKTGIKSGTITVLA